MHASNSIINFAGNTTVLGFITNINETAYREEVRTLRVWCQENNLTINVPIHIDGTVVEGVVSFKLLSVHITDRLKWSTHTDCIVKKAQRRLFNLRRRKKFGLSPKTLKLLQMHNQEHPVRLYHRLVQQLLRPQP
jgi:hypothetical protein